MHPDVDALLPQSPRAPPAETKQTLKKSTRKILRRGYTSGLPRRLAIDRGGRSRFTLLFWEPRGSAQVHGPYLPNCNVLPSSRSLRWSGGLSLSPSLFLRTYTLHWPACLFLRASRLKSGVFFFLFSQSFRALSNIKRPNQRPNARVSKDCTIREQRLYTLTSKAATLFLFSPLIYLYFSFASSHEFTGFCCADVGWVYIRLPKGLSRSCAIRIGKVVSLGLKSRGRETEGSLFIYADVQ